MLLELIGLSAAEVFAYNRENFEYDNETRLKRDLQRVEMQIARFDLFRQDIEDLVSFTVQKMDMYHLIGALFLGFTTVIYVEGRIHGNIVPPFFIAVYLLSVASSFAFFILCVWLSMHASIAAHSWGVRVRTRYVRLPIPSLDQIQSFVVQLSDFEKAGVAKMLRLPLIGDKIDWKKDKFDPAARDGATLASAADHDVNSAMLLDEGETGFKKDKHIQSNFDTVGGHPGKHLELFRKLQAKWQCFDAYARVSMSLGINQICQSISYYLMGEMMVQRRSLSTAIALVFVFQGAAVLLFMLDIAGLKRWQVLMVQLVGTLPSLVTLLAISLAERDNTNGLTLENEYYLGALVFFLQALWLELMIWVAKPAADEATLPRRFTAVMFIDVFSDKVVDATDVVEVGEGAGKCRDSTYDGLIAMAIQDLAEVWMALRRWQAIPQKYLNREDIKTLGVLHDDFFAWRRHVLNRQPKDTPTIDVFDDPRSWRAMSLDDKEADPFRDIALGPIAKGNYYDLEEEKEIEARTFKGEVLTIKAISDKMKGAKEKIRAVVAQEPAGGASSIGISRGRDSKKRSSDSDDSDEDKEQDGDEYFGVRKIGGERRRVMQVDRLPWKTLLRLIRILQLVWMLLGVIKMLELLGAVKIDYPLPPTEEMTVGNRRRLIDRLWSPPPKSESVPALEFSVLPVMWPPFGSYFHPTSIALLPGQSRDSKDGSGQFASDLDGLLVGSASVMYKALSPSMAAAAAARDRSGNALVQLRAATPREAFPAGAVALCGSAEVALLGASCLWGVLEHGNLVVWPFGQSKARSTVTLPLMGIRPWLHFAGAIVPCRTVSLLLAPGSSDLDPSEIQDLCLVLAGWDGESVPVAAVKLPGNASFEPPESSSIVAAYVDAPLPTRRVVRRSADAGIAVHCNNDDCMSSSFQTHVLALNIDATSGRLWAVLDTGDFHAWDLNRFESIALLQTRWAVKNHYTKGQLQAIAICDDSRHSRMLMLAKTPAGPQLLEARLSAKLLS